jgi:hypothetical protein
MRRYETLWGAPANGRARPTRRNSGGENAGSDRPDDGANNSNDKIET